jgi:catechol 2,3-dioxygenase-like lactoylglutathione lyase family enzyme
MKHDAVSIRPFIGAKDFTLSREFYKDLGFQESVIAKDFSYFHTEGIGFYLQDAFVKGWVDNTMVFMEVDDADRFWDELVTLDLTSKYEHVRLTPVRVMQWGKECFVHDPSGILWHFGEFTPQVESGSQLVLEPNL